MEPLVSVIIPTYNRESVVGRAIRSALDQIDVTLEVIVVDDGSEDDTELEVARIDSERVRYERICHAGPSVARNRGIEISDGAFVAFLDSDDVWYPAKLKRQLPLFDDPEVGWSYTDLDYVGEHGLEKRRFERRKVCRGWVLEHLFVNGHPMLTSSVVVRRSCLVAAGPFDPTLLREQDNDLYFRLATVARVDYIDEPLALYTHRLNVRSLPELKVSRARRFEIAKRVLERSPELYELPKEKLRLAFLNNLFELGRLEVALGNVEQAKEHFTQCTRHDPTFWKARIAGLLVRLPQTTARFLLRQRRRRVRRAG